MGRNKLKQRNQFQYLGIYISSKGQNYAEILCVAEAQMNTRRGNVS